MYPKLPLKFILLWIANLAVLVALSLLTGFHEALTFLQMRNVTYLYLLAGGILAGLEQALWDKLHGNE